MRIAVVGSGVSGLVTAHVLQRAHEVTVFEAGDRVGGHTHTVKVEAEGRAWAVDTGFIVFNDWTYPWFTRLLEQLKVPSQPSRMSFSVQCERTGLEYNGTSLNTLFAQRRNLLRPSFYAMLRDIVRFNHDATAAVDRLAPSVTMREFLAKEHYGRHFVEQYIVPMGAAIWSAPVNAVLSMPACFFLRFFRNHGMLSVDQRPTWRVVQGGSQAYVQALLAQLRQPVRLNAPIAQLRRRADAVELTPRGGSPERYDAVVLACHSDEALSLLADPSPAELEILSALRYQPNDVVLHTDTAVMPRCRRAWGAWNYHLPAELRRTVAVTYWMNCLQSLDAQTQFLVTLNDTTRIAPEKVLRRFRYSHPQFGIESLAAQARHGEISGVRRSHYCGAYWRYGFHEDGVMSALRVCQQLGLELDPAHAFAWK